ncbi:MAG TPA: response regulator [Woeseiaceae bacterium]|nr:response regulator [Woeseiaceae bacterium]
MVKKQTVFVVDDDDGIREGLGVLLETVDLPHRLFSSALEFLNAFDVNDSGCLLVDVRMPRMSGMDLQQRLISMGATLPTIFITGHGDIPMAVEAMRRGAVDFLRKPFREQELLDRINEALRGDVGKRERQEEQQNLLARVDSLSAREKEIFHRVTDGEMNKRIADDLGISQRAVEVHRAQVMKKLGVQTLAHLVRVSLAVQAADQ